MGRSRKSERAKRGFREREWPPGLYQRADGHFFWRRMFDGERPYASFRTKKAVAIM